MAERSLSNPGSLGSGSEKERHLGWDLPRPWKGGRALTSAWCSSVPAVVSSGLLSSTEAPALLEAALTGHRKRSFLVV